MKMKWKGILFAVVISICMCHITNAQDLDYGDNGSPDDAPPIDAPTEAPIPSTTTMTPTVSPMHTTTTMTPTVSPMHTTTTMTPTVSPMHTTTTTMTPTVSPMHTTTTMTPTVSPIHTTTTMTPTVSPMHTTSTMTPTVSPMHTTTLAPTGHSAPGHPTPGHPAPGHPAPGHPAPGHPAPGHPAPGHPAPGHPMPGHPAPGHPAPGHPMPGHPMPGHPMPGHPMPGHPGFVKEFMGVVNKYYIPRPHTHFRGYKYIYKKQRMTFKEATKYCSLKGGHVAHVNMKTQHQRKKVFEMFPGITKNPTWVGALFLRHHWFYLNFRPVNSATFGWNVGEPNHIRRETCVSSHRSGKANSTYCKFKRAVLCEVKIRPKM